MQGKLHYRIKHRQNGGKEENWVKDFKNTFQLAKLLWVAIGKRAETIHFYYSTKK